MGNIIAEEAHEIVVRLEGEDGNDVKVDQMFNIPVLNILWRIVAGKRYQVRAKLILVQYWYTNCVTQWIATQNHFFLR